MLQINQITDDTLQTHTIALPDGTTFTFTMYFVPMQYGWFITSLTYGSFVLNGIRIVNSPDILYQWRNQLPFGLACFSSDNREPQLQQDFASQNSILYVLSAAEVAQYGEYLSG